MPLFSTQKALFDFAEVPLNDFFQDIFTVAACVVLVFMALLFALYRKEARQFAQGLFASRVSAQVLRDGGLLRQRLVLVLFPCVLLVQSLLVYYLTYTFVFHGAMPFHALPFFGMSVGLCCADIALKFCASSFFAYMFDFSKNERIEYLLHKAFYLTDITLALFPLLLLAVYMERPYVLFGYMLLFLVFHIAMFVRLAMLNYRKGNLFQFFLYFCTVEILPYLIVLKTALLLGK